jgi:hypothetical protein
MGSMGVPKSLASSLAGGGKTNLKSPPPPLPSELARVRRGEKHSQFPTKNKNKAKTKQTKRPKRRKKNLPFPFAKKEAPLEVVAPP